MSEEQISESSFGSFLTSLGACVLVILQLFVGALGVASCWGGCSASALSSLFILGVLSAGGLLVSRIAWKQMDHASSFFKALTLLVLIPGGVGSAISALLVVSGFGIAAWQAVTHLFN